VVAEHRVTGGKLLDQLEQLALAAGAGDEVAADQRQVGLPLDDPVDRPLDRPRAPRGQSEVEVGQVRDPETA
jgi:hypothetical protein